MKYDIVAGMDGPTLARLVQQVYSRVYPAVFKNIISVNQMGISSVGFDINVCPQIIPANSPEAKAHFVEALNGHASDKGIALPHQDHIETLLARAMAATLAAASAVARKVRRSSMHRPRKQRTRREEKSLSSAFASVTEAASGGL